MFEIQLYTESFGTLLLLPQVPCLLVQWHGFANSRSLRQLLNKGLELYQVYAPQYPQLGWVSDARRFGAMLPADQDWAASDWNRRAYAAGIRQVVFISPNNIFGQIALQQFTQKVEQNAYLRIAQVASPEAAWERVVAA